MHRRTVNMGRTKKTQNKSMEAVLQAANEIAEEEIGCAQHAPRTPGTSREKVLGYLKESNGDPRKGKTIQQRLNLTQGQVAGAIYGLIKNGEIQHTKEGYVAI